MKNFIEKVKANKLRSALIGLSVFLFGFIAVNIFNNIGDTYAYQSGDEVCYYCGDTQEYIWGIYNSPPSGHSGTCSVMNSIKNKADCNNANNNSGYNCYYCSVTDEYLWRPGIPSESCPGGFGWTMKMGVTQTNCETGSACYLCGNTYYWGLYGDTGSCENKSNITKNT